MSVLDREEDERPFGFGFGPVENNSRIRSNQLDDLYDAVQDYNRAQLQADEFGGGGVQLDVGYDFHGRPTVIATVTPSSAAPVEFSTGDDPNVFGEGTFESDQPMILDVTDGLLNTAIAVREAEVVIGQGLQEAGTLVGAVGILLTAGGHPAGPPLAVGGAGALTLGTSMEFWGHVMGDFFEDIAGF